MKQATSSASSGDLATAKELKAAQEQIASLSEQVIQKDEWIDGHIDEQQA